MESTILSQFCTTMAKGAIHPLALGERDGVLLNGRKYLFVTCQEEILTKEQIAITPSPSVHASLF